MANPNHESDVTIGKHHPKPGDPKLGSTEGGKCLTRHVTGCVEGDSCSHRWQAYRRAVDNDSTWYNSYAQNAQKIFDPPIPAGTWHLGYGQNFRVSAKIPYRHNAHHIIPNGILNGTIDEAVENVVQSGDDGEKFRKLLRGALLDAPYNLNHMINMIILPRGKKTALFLKLPAHLEKGAQQHEEYDASVVGKVIDIIMDFASKLDPKPKQNEHPAAPKKLAKKKLEAASTRFRRAIRAWGVLQSELTLDRIPKSHFSKFD